ncbi:Guanine nucleotide-binding protein subunit beta, partial [Bienertia sinuspersici]
MADDLVEGWKKFSLTEDEDEEIDLDDIPDDEMAPQIGLALIGKLFTITSFNIEAMKNVLRASWKPIKGMVVREIDRNRFVFQFFCQSDRERVMQQSPWAFDNHLLLLKEISGHEQPRDFVFDSVDFWFNDSDVSGWAKFMRVRVRMDVHKPLPRGSTMKLGGERIWVDFRYERLSGFCFVCGCLRHGVRECDDYDEEVPENELPYGTWLRASPQKNRARMGNQDRENENKLFQELRGGSGTRKKLRFLQDNPLAMPDSSNKQVEMKADIDGMQIDGNEGKRGLALMWELNVGVSLQTFSSHHIDVIIESGIGEVAWRFTGVKERLDKFMASSEWNEIFPWPKVEHLDKLLSDHLPIQLHLNMHWGEGKNKGRRRFRFENMWADDDRCTGIIEEACNSSWNSDPVTNLSEKNGVCANKLVEWNKKVVGNVSSKIKEVKDKLR